MTATASVTAITAPEPLTEPLTESLTGPLIDLAPEPASVDPIELARQHWTDRGWSAAADGMAVVTSIMRVQQLFLVRIERLLRPHKLTFARFEVLRLLAFSRTGTLPIGKVGQRLQVHPASVTNAVQRLEDAELVSRGANPHDGRGVLVTITPTGRALVERCTDQLNREVFERLPLGHDEHRVAYAVLGTLRHAGGIT